MKKLVYLYSIALVLVLICNVYNTLPLVLAASAPCELYTQTDVEELFKENVSPGISRETLFPPGSICRYSFNKNGGSYGLNVRVCESSAIKTEGIQDSAADAMAKQKKTRKASPTASETFFPIPGLGDDAFWSGKDLWVLKGIKTHN